ncbi:MAG: hypothetical protein U5N21_25160 [Rhodococcus sp. (in: high G+C Gram-positive bacteria)]|nr:hypothetical protein [Rhodococcus sp. (in: high G+C Gram-positive bacteria)]
MVDGCNGARRRTSDTGTPTASTARAPASSAAGRPAASNSAMVQPSEWTVPSSTTPAVVSPP